nr:retrovirus-related Pol polyprotein from transposon opus [Tanacetum cinerariifolium]
MDENTVRLLLKEQQDAAERLPQHQAEPFKRNLSLYGLSYRQLLGCMFSMKRGGGRFNLKGAVTEWFRWMTRKGLITDWPRFEESVKNRCGPSMYEDPQGALSKELLVSKPTTLDVAFTLARIMEARLEDQGTVSGANKGASTSGESPYQRAVKTPLLPTPPKANVNPNAALNSNAKPLAIKWISPAER